MNNMEFIRKNENAILPTRGSNLSSGVDFYASNFKKFYGEDGEIGDVPDNMNVIMLKPLNRILVGTGWAINLLDGYEMQIRPKSGRALKEGLTVLNTPGTIDADYKDEIGIILVNLSSEIVKIELGQKIAQGVVAEVYRFNPVESDILKGEDRGGGFGSTGI